MKTKEQIEWDQNWWIEDTIQENIKDDSILLTTIYLGLVRRFPEHSEHADWIEKCGEWAAYRQKLVTVNFPNEAIARAEENRVYQCRVDAEKIYDELIDRGIFLEWVKKNSPPENDFEDYSEN